MKIITPSVSLPVSPQKSEPQPERCQVPPLKRSSSVQEMFSSPRNKLLRQSSLKQQKVLHFTELVNPSIQFKLY